MRMVEYSLLLALYEITIAFSTAKINITVTSVLGAQVTLNCPADWHAKRIIWTARNFTLFIDNQRQQGSLKEKYFKARTNQKSSLILPNISKEDEDAFCCEFLDTTSVSQYCFMIQISELLIYRDDKRVNTIEAHEGERITLNCNLTKSIDGVDLYWMRNGSEIRSPNSDVTTYTLNATRDLHETNLTCKAEIMKFNRTLTEDVTLNISYKPLVTIKASPRHILRENESVILICEYNSNPKPINMTWLFDGEIISHDIELVIGNFTIGNSGNYQCRVENDFGFSVAEILLTILRAPEKPLNFTVKPRMCSLLVTWIQGHDGGSEQSFVVKYRPLHTTRWYLLKQSGDKCENIYIPNLGSDTYYDIVMYAENEVGKSGLTDIIRVRTKEQDLLFTNGTLIYITFTCACSIICVMSAVVYSRCSKKQKKLPK